MNQANVTVDRQADDDESNPHIDEYYSRRNTLRRLIAEASVDELVEFIKLEKLSNEVVKIKGKL